MTLSNLSVTGAYDGIYLGNGSVAFTLQSSVVYQNAHTGLNIADAASSNAVIKDNIFYGDMTGTNRHQDYGVLSVGLDPTVLRNQAYHINGSGSYGIYLTPIGTQGVIRDNLVFHNSITGLYVSGSSFESSGNIAFNNARGLLQR